VQAAAAVDLEDKLQDAGATHAFTGVTPAVAVHVLWDFPQGFDAGVVRLAKKHGVKIGAINPNVFQDQCYKWGSVTNRDPAIRAKAVGHILDCIEIGRGHGQPESLAVVHRRHELPRPGRRPPAEGLGGGRLQEDPRSPPPQHDHAPGVQALRAGLLLHRLLRLGRQLRPVQVVRPRAKVLVDTGHHLAACNIEQIVAWLISEGMLGGFHFNDRKYADDDLEVGSIDPYQAFRIFSEIAGYEWETGRDLDIAYMIDQSHNLEPKVQAMIRTVCRVQELFAKSLCVDREALAAAQAKEDVILAEETLRAGFHMDVTPLLAAVRKKLGVPAEPLWAFRESGYEARAAAERTAKRKALGISEDASYA